MSGRCPASDGERCMLVIAAGAPCEGWSASCAMRPQAEKREALAEALAETVRRSFGIAPDGGRR